MFRRCFLAAVGLLLCATALTAQTPNTAPTPAATQAAPPQEAMEDPQVGDHWTYEHRDDITGDLKSTFTATITDLSENEISLRTSVIGNSNYGYGNYDRSWNRTTNGDWRYSPNDGGGIRAPLAVGKTWSGKSNDSNSSTGANMKRSVTSKVVAQESVTTRAGTFDTFKIEISFTWQSSKDPTKKAQDVLQTWYAPSIDHWVKQTSVMRSDGRVRTKTSSELVEYGRR
jgi:hypothetical protein